MADSMRTPAGGTQVIHDFTRGSIARELLLFALPLFLSNLLQIIYNLTDMLVVGQFVGSAGLSAVSIGGDITNFMTFLVMGFTGAGQVIISQFIGAGRRDRLPRFIGTMTTFLLLCAAGLTAAGLLFRGSLLDWMNTPAEARQYTLDYATTCIAGLVFIYGYNIVSAVFRGMGDSRHPFLFILIAASLNIALDLLFVAGFGMGPFGAALATVIGQAVSLGFSIAFLLKHRGRFPFAMTRGDFRPDREMLGILSRLGVPMAITSASVQFSKLFVNSWINSYGVVISAVGGIGNKFSSIGNLIANAMSTAGGSMVGQNIGAEKYDRVPKIMRTAFFVNLAFCSALALSVLLAPRTIFGFFTADAAVLDAAMTYIPISVGNLAACVLRSTMFTLTNGSGNSRISFCIALLDGLINRIGFALLLGIAFGLGTMGFWTGDVIANFTPFVIGGAYYLSG